MWSSTSMMRSNGRSSGKNGRITSSSLVSINTQSQHTGDQGTRATIPGRNWRNGPIFPNLEKARCRRSFYINSPGGLVTSGLGIYDTMQYIKPPVSTLCIGQASSMGSFLLAAGEKGKRFSLPNSRIMVHQPSAGYQGQATDIEIHAKEIMSLKERLNKIYSKHTKKNESEIKKALERDNFMTPNEAKDFGLIDEVVEKRS